MGVDDRIENARQVRQRAGRSRAWVAAMAGVSEPLATIYELDPDAVKSDAKRAALAAVYAQLESKGPRAA